MCFQNGMHFFCPKPIDTGMLRELMQIRKESESLAEAIQWIELRMDNQSRSTSAAGALQPQAAAAVAAAAAAAAAADSDDSDGEEKTAGAGTGAGAGAGAGVAKLPLFVNTPGVSGRKWRITKAPPQA